MKIELTKCDLNRIFMNLFINLLILLSIPQWRLQFILEYKNQVMDV